MIESILLLLRGQLSVIGWFVLASQIALILAALGVAALWVGALR